MADTRTDAGAEIGDRACGIRPVSERALIGTLVQQIELQLRHPVRVRLITQPRSHRGLIAGTVFGARRVQTLGHCRLELAVDVGIEVLFDGMKIIRADDQIGAAGASLQTGV
ncbi:MAG: hypothetical protein M3R20_03935 [Pseudomonadota bacterium]|nr:hypothetical protein [Pseudomonadota bacterium]